MTRPGQSVSYYRVRRVHQLELEPLHDARVLGGYHLLSRSRYAQIDFQNIMAAFLSLQPYILQISREYCRTRENLPPGRESFFTTPGHSVSDHFAFDCTTLIASHSWVVERSRGLATPGRTQDE